MDATDSQKLVEVFFRAQVFHFGTAFAGQVFDSERPLEVGQQVQGGDATFALDSNQVWAGIRLRGRLVSEVRAEPPVVTPNGDGINDAAGVEYSLLELVGAGQVAVDIFDLAGRLVRPLYRGHQHSGRHVHLWDGHRDDGQPRGTRDVSVSGASRYGQGAGRTHRRNQRSVLNQSPDQHEIALLPSAKINDQPSAGHDKGPQDHADEKVPGSDGTKRRRRI